MTAGSKRDGVLKGGGFPTPDLETAAVFVGNEPTACVRSGRCAFRFSPNGSLLRLPKESMAVQFVHEYLKTM